MFAMPDPGSLPAVTGIQGRGTTRSTYHSGPAIAADGHTPVGAASVWQSHVGHPDAVGAGRTPRIRLIPGEEDRAVAQIHDPWIAALVAEAEWMPDGGAELVGVQFRRQPPHVSALAEPRWGDRLAPGDEDPAIRELADERAPYAAAVLGRADRERQRIGPARPGAPR